MRKKIDAVLKMRDPTTQTEVQSFIGSITFYESMWPRHLYVLALLHELTGTGRFFWGP